jgi:hypothetical protein
MPMTTSPRNHYYFNNGAHIVARDTQAAFAEFRVQFGAERAVLCDTMSGEDYDALVQGMRNANNFD